jgi:four helix bundle protein
MRCAISVPANLAEGHGRGSKAQLLQFIDIARGSLSELEYDLHFLRNEAILPAETLDPLDAKQAEAGRVLFGLWRSLKAMPKQDLDHEGLRIREEPSEYGVD